MYYVRMQRYLFACMHAQMLKSRAGYEFDSSFCCDVNNVFEYNGLQDPHLKDYFYRPFMKEYLMNKKFVS